MIGVEVIADERKKHCPVLMLPDFLFQDSLGQRAMAHGVDEFLAGLALDFDELLDLHEEHIGSLSMPTDSVREMPCELPAKHIKFDTVHDLVFHECGFCATKIG